MHKSTSIQYIKANLGISLKYAIHTQKNTNDKLEIKIFSTYIRSKGIISLVSKENP